MDQVIEITDRTNRKIRLPIKSWIHIHKHPEMRNQMPQIEETLRFPDRIIQFEFDEHARFYYKYYKRRREYLCILVKYLNGDGFIITAHYTNKIK